MPNPEQSSLAHRWDDYQSLDQLRNHWYWRPGWSAGRSFYTWHITFADAVDVHQLVNRLHSRLTFPYLDLVPLSGLHLTMQGLGFTDEVSDRDVTRIIDAARELVSELRPFSMRLGPADPDAEGIGLLVQPWEPVIALRSALRQAIGKVWDAVPEPDNGFRPHVTIAYSGADAPTNNLREALAALRSLPAAATTVTQIQLIRLNRDDHVYRWHVAATVALGGGIS